MEQHAEVDGTVERRTHISFSSIYEIIKHQIRIVDTTELKCMDILIHTSPVVVQKNHCPSSLSN